ncbi:MAG TPA: DUF454 family protein [Alphaproteobacteria bacterium]|nr:DUF454 family protein [Alphaproteobacteria bacterium]
MKRPAWLTQTVKRKLYLVAGTFFVILGVLGLFLPILQGVLFLLVGLALLSKGSSRVRALKQKFKRRYPKWGAKLDHAEAWSKELPGKIKGWFGRKRD